MAGIKEKEYYSDFDNLFSVNEMTGDLVKKRNTASIKQSIKNLLNRRFYSKLWNPKCGSYVKSLLFKQDDPTLLSIIRLHTMELMERYEPRIRLIDIEINHPKVDGAVELTIRYREVETDTEQVFIYAITRLR